MIFLFLHFNILLIVSLEIQMLNFIEKTNNNLFWNYKLITYEKSQIFLVKFIISFA